MPDLFHELENENRATHYNQYQNFSASDLAEYDYRHIASNDSVTLTPASQGVAYGGPPTTVLQVTANGSDPTLNGNHREFFLRTNRNLENTEISSIFFGGTTWADIANRGQQGHVHRFQKLANGRFRAFVAWHDMVAGLPTTINVGIWEGDGTVAGLDVSNSSNAILTQSPPASYPITLASLTTNVVSINVPYGVGNYHYFRDNDLVDTTLANSALNVNDVRLTLGFGILMTYPKANADVTAIASGGGFIVKQGPQADFPYVFRSRLMGNMLQAKLYRLGDPEIPWSLTTNNAVYVAAGNVQDHKLPKGPGLSGVMVGHVSGGEQVRFGRPHIVQA